MAMVIYGGWIIIIIVSKPSGFGFETNNFQCIVLDIPGTRKVIVYFKTGQVKSALEIGAIEFVIKYLLYFSRMFLRLLLAQRI